MKENILSTFLFFSCANRVRVVFGVWQVKLSPPDGALIPFKVCVSNGGISELSFQAVCAWSLHQFGSLLDHSPLWLSDSLAQQVEQIGMLYLQTYMKLAETAMAQSLPRYRLRPKAHAFHCEVLCKLRSGSRLNPRFHSCFNDEDYVGRCCSVGRQSCHPNTMARRVLERLMLQTNTWLMGEKASCEIQCRQFMFVLETGFTHSFTQPVRMAMCGALYFAPLVQFSFCQIIGVMNS